MRTIRDETILLHRFHSDNCNADTLHTHTHTRLTALFPGLPALVLSQRTLPCTGVDVFRTGVGLSACECVRVFHLLICRVALPCVLGLVFSVPSQEIGWDERLRSDLFCVEWDVKLYSAATATAQGLKTLKFRSTCMYRPTEKS